MRWAILAVSAAAALLAIPAFAQTTAQPALPDVSETAKTAPSLWFALQSDLTNIPHVPAPSCGSVCNFGALASAKFDEDHHTTSAVVDGTAIFAVILGGVSPVQGAAFGAYFSSEGTDQFAAGTTKNKPSDILTPGGFAQAEISNPILHTTDSWRLRTGMAYASQGSRDATIVLEWQPSVSWQYGTPIPGINFFGTPEVELQYDHLAGGRSTFEIFEGGRKSAFRVGPQVAVALYADPYVFPKGSWERNLVFTVTAHAADDPNRRRGFGFIQAALSYRINSLYGVSANYGYGNSDITGSSQSLIKIGVTVKLQSPS